VARIALPARVFCTTKLSPSSSGMVAASTITDDHGIRIGPRSKPELPKTVFHGFGADPLTKFWIAKPW
jgi:hypothetical protein